MTRPQPIDADARYARRSTPRRRLGTTHVSRDSARASQSIMDETLIVPRRLSIVDAPADRTGLNNRETHDKSPVQVALYTDSSW